jgi:hypothetical protein
VALIGHLQVAQQNGAASATPIAASSGPIPKAPGSAGGYLPNQAVKARLTEIGTNPMILTADELRAHIASETEKWGKVVRAANIKAD